MLMDLTHWARHNEPLVPRSVPQSGNRLDKPDGLWVSVDGEDDWPSWCENEGWNLDEWEPQPWRVELTVNNGLLVIDRLRLLAEFTAEYQMDVPGTGSYAIDWKRVAKKYNGIIIAPYQWPARLDRNTMWYYGWDCASGCIWDTRAIEGVHQLTDLAPR